MRDFTVVVLEGAYATSVAVTLDMLAAAAALAPRLGLAVPTWRLVSAHGGPVQLRSGLSVDTAKLSVRSSIDRSVWIVPGVGLDTPTAIEQRFGDDDVRLVLAALRRHAKAGGGVAASCSAVFLLQAAGLLEGRRVTTSWWLAPLLKRLAPECTVDADRMVCADGPIVTAGAAFAQTDLMLYLLRAHGGNALADQVAARAWRQRSGRPGGARVAGRWAASAGPVHRARDVFQRRRPDWPLGRPHRSRVARTP
jgi:transcriptional regulator GlxA family with amidase domain